MEKVLVVSYFFLFSCSFESFDPLSGSGEDDAFRSARFALEFMLLFKAARAALSVRRCGNMKWET